MQKPGYFGHSTCTGRTHFLLPSSKQTRVIKLCTVCWNCNPMLQKELLQIGCCIFHHWTCYFTQKRCMLQKKRKNKHLNCWFNDWRHEITYTEERLQLTFSDWPSFAAPGSLNMVLYGCLCVVRIAYWTQKFNCLQRESVPDIPSQT